MKRFKIWTLSVFMLLGLLTGCVYEPAEQTEQLEVVTAPKNVLQTEQTSAEGPDLAKTEPTSSQIQTDAVLDAKQTEYVQEYYFKNKDTRNSHFKKHGAEFGGIYKTAEEYETGADKVAHDPAALHKLEKEDNDDVYYIEKTNEFVIVSPKGYIRTYFKPSAGKKYFERQ
ncbi:MAG: hypothetical protein IJR59_07300 [Firmicutes bacterium]|nr:hypothetical protein [Bacillota bacterium]